ncbi:hypothetical protein [Armatimonas sp.]|uniref:hypothetical protein n=1 Tax=Armatimonas sp. TaxID=1872638 RepID=UPI00286C2899|nr:hypothetical protein [Armatimonas sp.]
MPSRLSLNTLYTILLTLSLVLELVARVVFLGTSLLMATLSLFLVAGTAVVCLWYASLPRSTPLTGMALLCRVVVTTQVVLSAKDLLGAEALPLVFRWGYAIACLALSVVTAFTLERDLRLVLSQHRDQ